MSKGNKTDIVIAFRLKCDSQKEAKAILELYDAQIRNFTRFVRASSCEILISEEKRDYIREGED